ncbi:MAG: nuclear transport factor 2 family protein [Candidatus Sericytochromatia bacterium]
MSRYEDRQDISDLLVRYATGIDRHDWALFRTVFTDDCRLDYGEVGSWDGVGAVTEFMKMAHQGVQTLHRMTNKAIEVDGDRATARTYVDMVMVGQGGSGVNAIGYYDDDIVRTEDGWRIARRRFTSVRLNSFDG